MKKIIIFLIMFILLINNVSAFALSNCANYQFWGSDNRNFTQYYTNGNEYIYMNVLIEVTLPQYPSYFYMDVRLDNNTETYLYEDGITNNTIVTTYPFTYIIPPNQSYGFIDGSSSGVGLMQVLWRECKLISTVEETTIINQTVINQTLNVSNDNLLKTIILKDDSNIKYINSYNYSVYLDDLYWKDIKLGDVLLIPDNSSILIYSHNRMITGIDDSYSIIKSSIINIIGYLLTFGIIIIFVFILIKKVLRK